MTMHRRSFLKSAAVLGTGLALVPQAVLASLTVDEQCVRTAAGYKVSRTAFTMGTYVTITAVHGSRNKAEHEIGLAFAEIERLRTILDRFDASTPLAVLNDQGRITGAPAELNAVMAQAKRFHALTNGSFDMTVQPVVELLAAHRSPSGKSDLSEKEVRNILALVDSDGVRMDDRSIALSRSGMGVTLDGIGKGYIVDRVSDRLAAAGIANHLINAGGDIRTRGERAPGKPWTVAVEDPAKKGNYPAVLTMRDGALATSGGYEVFFDKARTRHHVVNPDTGICPQQSVSVSVLAGSVMEADALSTAAFVKPPKQGLALIGSLPGRETLIVGNSGRILKSGHWPA